MARLLDSDTNGFTLLEVLIAMVLVAALAAGVAELTTLAARATQAAHHQTTAATAAIQKMEELRALRWAFLRDVAGSIMSDTTSDLSLEPSTTGGSGLSAAASSTLTINTPGYVDYVDAGGRWAGTGLSPPAGAMYVRRWSVQRLSFDAADTVILKVFVTTVAAHAQRVGLPAGSLVRSQDDVLLVSVRTRLG